MLHQNGKRFTKNISFLLFLGEERSRCEEKRCSLKFFFFLFSMRRMIGCKSMSHFVQCESDRVVLIVSLLSPSFLMCFLFQ